MIYNKYKTYPLWKKLDQLIADLESNKDIQITTSRNNVIGYLVKNILEE